MAVFFAQGLPVKGRLESHPLQEVLRALLAAPRDGCLTVSRGKIRRRLYLKGGMIVYATSTNPRDRLGEVLVAQGKLTREDHRQFWEKSQAEQRLLGITLMLEGRITPADLYQAVMAQMVTILERLRKWRRGQYLFEEGCAPQEGTVLLRIPLVLLVLPDRAPARTPKGEEQAPPLPQPSAGEDLRPLEPHLLGGGQAQPASAADVPPSPGAAREAGLGVGRPLDVSQEARIGEFSFHVQELRQRRGQDPRTFLGVSCDAGREVVRLAHRRLADLLGADRLPEGAPAELAREGERLREEVDAAFRAIEEEGGRRVPSESRPPSDQYVAPPVGRTPKPEPSDRGARSLAHQARQEIREGNWWQAAQSLRQAVRLNPEEAQFRSQLGYVLMQAKRPREAEEHLLEAIRLDPGNPAHHFNLGLVYKSGRLPRKARAAFEQVLRLDPKHGRARAELREIPEEPATEKGGTSLLRKLFGG